MDGLSLVRFEMYVTVKQVYKIFGFVIILVFLLATDFNLSFAQDGDSVTENTVQTSALFANVSLDELRSIELSQSSESKYFADVRQWRLVKINTDIIHQVTDDNLMNRSVLLNLFPDKGLWVTFSQIEENSSGSRTWIGKPVNFDEGMVIFVERAGTLSGYVFASDGDYEIKHFQNDIHIVSQLDPTKPLMIQDNPILVDSSKISGNTRGSLAPADSPFDKDLLLDVLVVYSDDVVQLTSVEDVESTIELSVAYTNETFRMSGVNHRLSLIGMRKVDYDEPPGIGYAIEELTTKGDNKLDVVHQWRDELHADLVVLLTAINECSGVANLQGLIVPEFESRAFSVVGYCRMFLFTPRTFAHELGHNMGARHDWYMDSESVPYAYAHGHVSVPQRFYTIMAYHLHCWYLEIFDCRAVPFWSNPELKYKGAALGVADNGPTNCKFGVSPPRDVDAPDPSTCAADDSHILNTTSLNIDGFRSSQAIWTGEIDDNWHNPKNWEMIEGAINVSASQTVKVNRVPRMIDDVLIPSKPAGNHYPAIASDTTLRHITIEPGAVLNISKGSLRVFGNFDGKGDVAAFGGKVVFEGTQRQLLSVTKNSFFNDLQIGNSTTQDVELVTDLKINGNLDVEPDVRFSTGNHLLQIFGDIYGSPFAFQSDFSDLQLNGIDQRIVGTITSTAVLSEAFTTNVFDGNDFGVRAPYGWDTINSEYGWFQLPGGTIKVVDTNSSTPFTTPESAWLFSSRFQSTRNTDFVLTINYHLEREDCTVNNLSIFIGNSKSPTAMSRQLWTGSGITDTSWTTLSVPFYVEKMSEYYLGFHATGSAPNKYTTCGVEIDSVRMVAGRKLVFSGLSIGGNNGGDVRFETDTLIENDLTIMPNRLVDLSNGALRVNGEVLNFGGLRQTVLITDQQGTIDYSYLNIMDQSGLNIKYRGVNIHTVGQGELGLTTIQIDGNRDCRGDSTERIVTSRCFTITPTQRNPSTVKFWLSEAERAQLSANELALFVRVGNKWLPNGNTVTHGETGEVCVNNSSCWFEVSNISDYGLMSASSPYVDLDIAKSVFPTLTKPGSTITYTIDIANLGYKNANDVFVSDFMPDGIINVSVTSTVPISKTEDKTFRWLVEDLMPGTSGTITLTGQVDTEIDVPLIDNHAVIQTSSNDLATANNSSSAESRTGLKFNIFLPVVAR